jgi:hypothetical protein
VGSALGILALLVPLGIFVIGSTIESNTEHSTREAFEGLWPLVMALSYSLPCGIVALACGIFAVAGKAHSGWISIIAGVLSTIIGAAVVGPQP